MQESKYAEEFWMKPLKIGTADSERQERRRIKRTDLWKSNGNLMGNAV